AAARLPKALDPDNRGAGTNRKLLGRLAPRSSTFDLRNHSFPHLPRIGLRHRPASQKRINADRLSHLWPHENPPDSIGAEHALALGLVAIAPSFALEDNQCYSACKARCVARYACEGRHPGPNCFTNLNKCRTSCWRMCRHLTGFLPKAG